MTASELEKIKPNTSYISIQDRLFKVKELNANTEGIPIIGIDTNGRRQYLRYDLCNYVDLVFKGADTASSHIISYGWLRSKKLFKITYHDSMYFAWKKTGRSFEPIGSADLLETAINFCEISI